MNKCRPIALILALLMLAMTACGVNRESDTTTTSSTSDPIADAATTPAETVPAETEAPLISGVPEILNLNGGTINVYASSKDYLYNFDVSEITGDLMDDAIYEQMMGVEQKLGCDIVVTDYDGTQTDLPQKLSTMVLAQDTSYDLFFSTQWSACQQVSKGLYLNIADAPYISFDRPWWDMNYMSEMSIGNDRLYTLCGDFSIDRTAFLSCVFYNKELYGQLYENENGLYDMVSNKQWTYEAMAKISGEIYADLNSNGTVDGDDRLGATICWNNDVMSLLYCTDARITERDADGIPTLVMSNERNLKVMEDLFALAFETPGILYDKTNEKSDIADINQRFVNGNAMFRLGFLNSAYYLREMTDDYGIIPMPANEEGEECHSMMLETIRLMFLPINCQKVDEVCAVLEEMAFIGYRDVLPVYYEVALKARYARDDISSQMIDLIRDNLINDIALIYGSGFGDICYAPRAMIRDGQSNFSSRYKTLEKVANASAKALINAFTKLDG